MRCKLAATVSLTWKIKLNFFGLTYLKTASNDLTRNCLTYSSDSTWLAWLHHSNLRLTCDLLMCDLLPPLLIEHGLMISSGFRNHSLSHSSSTTCVCSLLCCLHSSSLVVSVHECCCCRNLRVSSGRERELGSSGPRGRCLAHRGTCRGENDHILGISLSGEKRRGWVFIPTTP